MLFCRRVRRRLRLLVCMRFSCRYANTNKWDPNDIVCVDTNQLWDFDFFSNRSQHVCDHTLGQPTHRLSPGALWIKLSVQTRRMMFACNVCTVKCQASQTHTHSCQRHTSESVQSSSAKSVSTIAIEKPMYDVRCVGVLWVVVMGLGYTCLS